MTQTKLKKIQRKKRKPNDFISTEQARLELGEEAYFELRRWLRERDYLNLTEVSENRFLNDIFITQTQLTEFVAETIRGFKGDSSVNVMWGQTREHLKENPPKKRKRIRNVQQFIPH